MYVIGIPDDVDPQTVRAQSDWRSSARCQREFARRETMIAATRDELAALPDRELRAKAAEELKWELESFGPAGPPRGFPIAATMSRDEMLDFLAERFGGFDPQIELVYPGAVDPTA